jgi:hypothetical protein
VLAIGVAGQNPDDSAPLLGAITSLAIFSFLGCLVVLAQPMRPPVPLEDGPGGRA